MYKRQAELNFKDPILAAKSAIMSSFSLYSINFYDEALESLNRFFVNYPADKNVMYAHYLSAIIHFEQIEDERHDLEPLLNAQKKIDLIPTRDNISVFELARGKHTILDILNQYKNTTTDSETPESPSQESVPDPFDIRINNFLEYLKEKKTEYENNHKNNESYKNKEFIDTLTQLIDDTYITIRAQTSRLGNMYLRARAVTQATERAYNVADTDELEACLLYTSPSPRD